MSEEKKEKEKSAEPTEELKETGSMNICFLCWPKSKTAVRLMVF